MKFKIIEVPPGVTLREIKDLLWVADLRLFRYAGRYRIERLVIRQVGVKQITMRVEKKAK